MKSVLQITQVYHLVFLPYAHATTCQSVSHTTLRLQSLYLAAAEINNFQKRN